MSCLDGRTQALGADRAASSGGREGKENAAVVTTPQEGQDLAETFAAMARALLDKHTVEDTLDTIVNLAVENITGCDYAAVSTADRDGHVETTSHTGELARLSDALQYELREGPCHDALWEHEIFIIDDMSHERRWPHYSSRAAELGIASVLAYRLFTRDNTLGVLDLYSTRPHAFEGESRQLGLVFAAHAAVALSWSHTEAALREAIHSRQIIGEAIGVLMERYKLTSEQSFDVLKRASQESNVKLRKVAQHVATTGESPFDADR